MPSTRREFLAVSGLGTAGLLCPGSLLWAAPPGARKPAPASSPPTDRATQEAIGRSPVPADEPLALAALEAAREAGASYADARLVRWRRERLSVRDRRVDGVSRGDEYGIGVRVIADGAWGFAATHQVDRASVIATARKAVQGAKAGASLSSNLGAPPVELSSETVGKGVWVAPHDRDPFEVPIGDKADLLLAATAGALAVPGVAHADASVMSVTEDKLFVSTEGSRVHQIFHRIMPSLSATAVDRRHGLFARRDHEAAPMLAGWEYVEGLKLPEAAARVGREVLQKLHAPSVEPGTMHAVLAPSNLWLTIHESIGHPTELDRALGLEADFAGTSFIRPDDAGKLRIGSDLVEILADRTQPGGLATTAWDDDGVPAQRWPIVKKGEFVGWQTTRDQAAWIGEAHSRGCSYGQGYKGVAFQRMPNVSLQPGKEGYTTEDLVNATENGVLISGRGSWSIDHQRYNFQFSGQMFWKIERGRIVHPLRDVAYQANTVDFWRSCDMIGGKGTYRLGGSFNDGKGQPGQSNAVSHGCPPARFTVDVINTGGDK
jgi:TldD protein